MVKQAILTITPRFSARRMLKDYVETRLRAGDPATESLGSSAAAIIAVRWLASPPKPVRCALCGTKDVSEPRGDERYCRDCWDKKIAVEDIVAREFTLKRYIRAHSAEKYLVYHSTQKRPVGQLQVHRRRLRSVPDGAALPDVRRGTTRRTTSRTIPSTGRSPRSWSTSIAADVIEPWGGGKWHLEVFRSTAPDPEDWNGEM